MKREQLQQTYRRDMEAETAALQAIKRRVESGAADPDPFDGADGLPDLPDADDEVVAELRPARK